MRSGRAGVFAMVVLTIAVTAACDRGARPRLIAAHITEIPPFDTDRIADRMVMLSLVLDITPICDDEPPSFAFLLDADRSTATGAVREEAPELGVDKEIAILCDVAASRFTSAAGDVNVRPAPDGEHGVVVSLTTRVGNLPSLEFDWIAMAREGGRVSRMPAAGRAAAWRVLERWR